MKSSELTSGYEILELDATKTEYQIDIRPLSKLALVRKMSNFCADFSRNFESLCVHMVEKFNEKDAKKSHFNNQMEFRKRSIKELNDGFTGSLTIGKGFTYSKKTPFYSFKLSLGYFSQPPLSTVMNTPNASEYYARL